MKKPDKSLHNVPTPEEIGEKMEEAYSRVYEVTEKIFPLGYHEMREINHECGKEKEIGAKNGEIDSSLPWMVYTMPHAGGRSVKQTYDNILLLKPENPDDAKVLLKIADALEELPDKLEGREMFLQYLSTSLQPYSAEKIEFLSPKEYSRCSEFMRRQFSRFKNGPEVIGKILWVPDWGEDMGGTEKNKIIFFDPEKLITIILGSNYAGEGKKSMMRCAQFIHTHIKKKGLGIHAGGFDAVFVENRKEVKRKGVLVFGLSGTGKSTTSMMKFDAFDNHFKQDDMFLLNFKDGSANAMERGMYVKTDWESNDPDEHPIQGTVIAAAKQPSAMIENVHLVNGEPDFAGSKEEFPNGRALVPREGFRFASRDPNMNKADIIFFNVRGPFPVLQKMKTPEQAATFFALGETIKRAGTVVEEKGGEQEKLEKKEESLERVLENRRIPKPVFMTMLNALYLIEPELREQYPHFKDIKSVLEEAEIDLEKVMEYTPWREAPTRVMGFDPFTPQGFKEERIKALLKFLKLHPVEVYVMNTGAVGAENIKIVDTQKVMEAVIADRPIQWAEDGHTGTLVAKNVDGVEDFRTRFDLEIQFGKEVYAQILRDMRKDRKNYLKRFSKLGFLTLNGKNPLF